MNDTYVPITNWIPWTADASGLSAAYLKTLGVDADGNDYKKDRWVLVTVGAMDEAGNVTPWPDDQLVRNGDGTLSIAPDSQDKDKGRTWYRFFFEGASSVVDTTLGIRFTYNLADNPDGPNAQKEDLGSATILEYPPAGQIIVGTFDVDLVRSSDCQSASVILELERDGEIKFRTTIDAGMNEHVTIKLPQQTALNAISPQPEDVFLSPPPYPPFSQVHFQRVVNYVLRATTVATCLNTAGYPVDLADTSPANFSFKVVPKSLGQYLESSGGEQPIKVFERE
jgi:hypothetical protein